ncbi:MAG: M48 family metalloprotease [Burkholderiales bacterium]|nr:M48 family metalloprotease [Burkholderiales bacterium]
MPSTALLKKSVAALVAMQLAVGPVQAQTLPDLGDSAESSLPEAQERSIGKRVMLEIRADRSFVEDAELTDYATALGQRLLLASGSTRGDIEFFLLQDDSINAFALVGGFIGLHTGLILAAQSESELAGVVGHEIAHILQRHQARMLAGQKNAALGSLVAMALAILAAKGGNSSQAPEAAIAAASGLQIQSMLDYSRDFERESDRLGFQMVERAGFDPRGMASFFERLQRANRHNDGRTPGYLRTHPLTTDRIADMQNRVALMPARNVPDSVDFQFAQAKLRALQGSPADAAEHFRNLIAEKTIRRSRADLYGLAVAQKRQRDFAGALASVQEARRGGGPSPWIENLAGEIRMDEGKPALARDTYEKALAVMPGNRALFQGHVASLLETGATDQALTEIEARLRRTPEDVRLYDLLAKAHAAAGRQLAQHRALAEAHYRRGRIAAAVNQLDLALKQKDGNFYERSSAEARSRELKAELIELKKDKKYDPSEREDTR